MFLNLNDVSDVNFHLKMLKNTKMDVVVRYKNEKITFTSALVNSNEIAALEQ